MGVMKCFCTSCAMLCQEGCSYPISRCRNFDIFIDNRIPRPSASALDEYCRYPSTKIWLKDNWSSYTSALIYVHQSITFVLEKYIKHNHVQKGDRLSGKEWQVVRVVGKDYIKSTSDFIFLLLIIISVL